MRETITLLVRSPSSLISPQSGSIVKKKIWIVEKMTVDIAADP